MSSRPKRKKGVPKPQPSTQNFYAPYMPMEITPAGQAEEILRKQHPFFGNPEQDPRSRYPVSDNALDIFIQGTVDPKFDPNKPYHGINPPEQGFEISIQPVVAAPRKLKTLWTVEAADDLKSLWGHSAKPDNALDLLSQGIDDPEFNPDVPYRGRRDHSDDLVDAMAKEMTEEIDKEIIRSILAKVKGPKVP